MRAFKIHRYLATLWLVLAITSAVCCTEICLLQPYITSMTRAEIKDVSNGLFSVNLKGRLNYGPKMVVDNIISDLNALIGGIDARSSLENWSGLPSSNVIYYEESILSANRRIERLLTKEDYFSQAKRFEGRRSPSFAIAGACSPIHVFRANFLAPDKFEPDKYLHVVYRNTYMCSAFGDASTGYNETSYKLFYFLTDHTKRTSNIVSATYAEPFLFEITADGLIAVHSFRKGDNTAKTDPQLPLGMLHNTGIFRLTRTPNDQDISLPVLAEKECVHKIELVNVTDPDLPFDYGIRFPLKTFTRISQKHFYSIESLHMYIRQAPPVLHFRRRVENGPFHMWRGPSEIHNINEDDYSMEAISVLPASGSKMYYHAFFMGRKTVETLYVFSERDGTSLRTIFMDRVLDFVIPDDITHWTSCERVVSVYGFVYGLHKYDDNLLKYETEWRLLEQSMFNTPIEAMHSEGDEFWFFTKRTTVLIMTADHLDCSQLKFSNRRELHLRQVLEFIPKQLMVEGRYYDKNSALWKPEWNLIPTSLPQDENMDTIWLYLAGGLLGALVLLVVALVVALRLVSKPPRPPRSRHTSLMAGAHHSAGHLPHADLLKAQAAHADQVQRVSAMPLLSEHPSIRTDDSNLVHEVKPLPRSPRKSPKSSPLAPKKSKSRSPSRIKGSTSPGKRLKSPR